MRAAVMFSGGAGTSIGARQAGARIVWAANHSPACVAVHASNFPDCNNVCQDLHLFNHAAMDEHDILLASPVCRGNSSAARPARAKSRKIQSAHNAMRALAWSVIDAAEVNRPPWIVVENVPEFRQWELFDIWLKALRRLGYRLTVQTLTATAWGVPQARERLFVIGHLGARPLRVRDPAADPPPMQDAIDWSEKQAWLPFSACRFPKARAQLERADHDFGGAKSFVQLVTGRPVFPGTEPLRTMTTQDQVRFVYRGRFRYPTAEDAFALMGFPSDYVLPEVGRTIAWAMAGDAVCPPVMRGIVERIIDAT